MSEREMWEALRPEMRGLHACRIESTGTGVGTPDVNYAQGWVELKYKREWPKRASTPLRIEHYTKEQKSWAIERTLAGGRVFLLLKVGTSEWLLFQGAVAAQQLGNLPRAALYRHTLARWTRKPRRQELLTWLMPPSHPPTEKPSSFGVVASA